MIFATGRTTTHGLWVLNRNNIIDNVFKFTLLALTHEALSRLFCLSYFCFEDPTEEILLRSNGTCSRKQASSGAYIYVDNDPTVSLIVSNKGPNFMNVYAALPLTEGQNVTYHILNPTRYRENYIHAFAVRALDDTEVTILPTSAVKIFRPAVDTFPNVKVEIFEAYDEVVLQLSSLETVWVEAVVEACDSGVTLTGTLIESFYEIAVFSAQALCNKTFISTSNSTGNDSDVASNTLPFSFILNPLRQLPPVHKWGTLYLSDLTKLSSFYSDDMEHFVVSFSILSASQSDVTITCYSGEEVVCSANQVTGEGEIWRYELFIKTMHPADAIVIKGSAPMLVLHEVYSQRRDPEEYHSELLQPTEWFLEKQAVPILHALQAPHPQAVVVNLVMEKNMSSGNILVWDNRDSTLPRTLGSYKGILNYSLSEVADYVLVHIKMDPTAYGGGDYVLQFAVNSTDNDTKFGASVFSHGGYAYSNGYILGIGWNLR